MSEEDDNQVLSEEELNDATREDPVDTPAEDDGKERNYPCHQCGAHLKWTPGVQALACPYCGHQEEQPQDEVSIREYAFNDYLSQEDKQSGLGVESRTLKCGSCAAEVELAAHESASVCPFCGSSAIDAAAHEDRILPEGIIPFAKNSDQARDAFRAWLKKLWFAPNDIKKVVRADSFQGVYRPFWTFDSHTRSHYQGYRGDYYYVTRTRTRDGKTETYQERRTRWSFRSGTYQEFIDDHLTVGFRASKIEADEYRLHALQSYDSSMIAGFLCERYTIDPKGAWPVARKEIESSLYNTCSNLIGGDTQRSVVVNTAHTGITFKSVLLPAWHSAYKYKQKIFQIVVNGQNGRVTAQRPYSILKITLFTLMIIAIIIAIVYAVR
ncbi:MAG: hypothetical protein HRU15_10460 [Planctomycetes bacterium]|nr:hypothetical protein [Planctomycetota bacterium]